MLAIGLYSALSVLRQEAIRIDVPVDLAKADVVFNIMNPQPIPGKQNSLFLAQVMTGVLSQRGTPKNVIMIFHSGAAAFACGDSTFNRLTGTSSGNPYKSQISDLQKAGVHTEICVKSMEFQKITRNQLLPGIKVNGGALLRVIELTQKGYTQFSF